MLAEEPAAPAFVGLATVLPKSVMAAPVALTKGAVSLYEEY
jgi:hypothetical protein